MGFGAGVGRLTGGIQTAFVADADAVFVVPLGMGTFLIEGTAGMNHAVPGDVEMVPDVGKATGQVVAPTIFQRVATVATGGAAMYHNQVDEPVVLILTACEDGHAHRAQPPTHACVPRDVAIAVKMVMTIRSTLLQMDSFIILFGFNDG